MNTFLINCSNLKNGGGLQVAQSVCSQLKKYQQHHFIVVLSSYITGVETTESANSEFFRYDIKNNLSTLLLGRDKFLDGLVTFRHVDAVLTIFGPSRWRPRCKHLCGFARAQLLLKNPLESELSWKTKLIYKAWAWAFRRSSDTFYTENKYISDMLPRLLGNKVNVYTVSNYYNQVFDLPDKWQRNVKLPTFEGTTLLTVATPSVHKNLKIMIPVSEYLEQRHSEFKFRFVLTCQPEALNVPAALRHHFVFVGKVDVAECPNLYEQADIMFMPTLLECFTATYPEAMRMEVPIVTTDLEFARGLCGDAACYYRATDPAVASDAIYKVATDKEYAHQLTEAGKRQLQTYDNYEQRADKLIAIMERMVTHVVPLEMGGVNSSNSPQEGGWPHDNHSPHEETDIGANPNIPGR